MAGSGSGSSGCWHTGHLTEEAEHLGVEPLGDLCGGRVAIGSDLTGDRVVSDTGSAVRQLLDEDGNWCTLSLAMEFILTFLAGYARLAPPAAVDWMSPACPASGVCLNWR